MWFPSQGHMSRASLRQSQSPIQQSFSEGLLPEDRVIETKMAFKSLCYLLTIVTVGVLLMSGGVTSTRVIRQKRSDDGGPLEVVVARLSQQVSALNAQLTQQVSALNAKVTALESKTSKPEQISC